MTLMWMSRTYLQDIIVISTLYLAVILSPQALTRLPPLVLDLLFFAAPALYLILRRKKNLPKIFLATLLIGLLAAGMDIFLLHNGAWRPYASSFSFRFFGAPPEEILWFFLHIFYILVFYEHFIDNERTIPISRRTKYLAAISITVFMAALFLVSVFGAASRIHYAYLTVGAITMLPTLLYLLFTRAHFAKKLAPLILYFFLYALVMEIQAVRFGLWSFTDTQNYVGLITLFGAAFPIEEVFFWMAAGPAVTIVYYEFFIDDTQ